MGQWPEINMGRESKEVISLGKLPPQAPDLEENVLGAIMLEKGALDRVKDLIPTPDVFYKDDHREIFIAIQELHKNDKPVDISLVTQKMRERGTLDRIGGPYYITQLTNRVSSAANIEHHTRIIVEQWMKRELIRISGEAYTDAYDDTSDIFRLLESVETNIVNLNVAQTEGDVFKAKELLANKLVHLSNPPDNDSVVQGIPTGLYRLDKHTGGWHEGNLIVIAATPGMGKSAFANQAAVYSAYMDYPTAFFPYEMGSSEYINRTIAAETGISYTKVRNNTLTLEENKKVIEKTAKLALAPLYFVEDIDNKLEVLIKKIYELVKKFGVKAVYIDYLQLLYLIEKTQGRTQEITKITTTLKTLARRLKISIIILSQLSREVFKDDRYWKIPKLHHLRESGSIEQDADMVLFLWRPTYYNIEQDSQGNPYDPTHLDIIIAKNRNGEAPKTVSLKWVGAIQKIFDVNPSDVTPEPNENKITYENGTVVDLGEDSDELPF